MLTVVPGYWVQRLSNLMYFDIMLNRASNVEVDISIIKLLFILRSIFVVVGKHRDQILCRFSNWCQYHLCNVAGIFFTLHKWYSAPGSVREIRARVLLDEYAMYYSCYGPLDCFQFHNGFHRVLRQQRTTAFEAASHDRRKEEGGVMSISAQVRLQLWLWNWVKHIQHFLKCLITLTCRNP